MRSRLLCFALGCFAALTASASNSPEMEIIGFGADGGTFAFSLYGIADGTGAPYASMEVYSISTGKKLPSSSAEIRKYDSGTIESTRAELRAASMRALEALGVGRDPGAELYRTGTATATTFPVGGKTASVRLEVKPKARNEFGRSFDSVTVWIEHGGRRKALLTSTEGSNYALNAVRLAADGKGLAVLVKYSRPGFEGDDRTYLCAAGRLP